MRLFWKWKYMDLKIDETLLFIRRIFLRFLFLRLLVIFFLCDCICFSDHPFLLFILCFLMLIEFNILSGNKGKMMNFSTYIIKLYRAFVLFFLEAYLWFFTEVSQAANRGITSLKYLFIFRCQNIQTRQNWYRLITGGNLYIQDFFI